MFTVPQAVDPIVEVIEAHVEVPRIPPCRLQAEPCRPHGAGGHDRQPFEADEWPLLGELAEGEVTDGKDVIPGMQEEAASLFSELVFGPEAQSAAIPTP